MLLWQELLLSSYTAVVVWHSFSICSVFTCFTIYGLLMHIEGSLRSESIKDCSICISCTCLQKGRIFCMLISIYKGCTTETVKHLYGDRNCSEIATEIIIQKSFMQVFLELSCVLNFDVNRQCIIHSG